MIIAIDTRWIRSKVPDGIGRVALGLAKELIKEKRYTYILLYSNGKIKSLLDKDLKAENYSNIKWLKVNYPVLSLKDFMLLPSFLRRQNIDIYYTFNYLTSWRHKGYKVIITIYDLIPYLFRENFRSASLKWRIFFTQKFFVKKMLMNSDSIISVSKSTKNDVIKIFNIPQSKIKIVCSGIKSLKEDSQNVESKRLIHKDYILYVGRKDPYKNLKMLISAYAEMDNDTKNKYSLVIAGKKDDIQTKLLKKEIENYKEQDNIVFFDDIKNEELSSLYEYASLFIYPSLYEGFGLPPLEAMSFGVPVVASDISSLKEVLGDAALYVNPKNTSEIKDKISELLNNKELRGFLIKKGFEQVKKFSWEKSAKKIINIFNNLERN